MVLGFSSCKQEDEPQYRVPTAFKINTPALQNVEFETATDVTDGSTFNLFCSQPDYGFSAVCNYSALVSLDPECNPETAVNLSNTNATSSVMAFKTYDLGVALSELTGYNAAEDYYNSDLYKETGGVFTAYFRAVCQIPGIESSLIVSDNVVSLNKVKLNFQEKVPGWIYICGEVKTLDGAETNGFLAPSQGNYNTYKEFWSLYEPDDMIDSKLYVGQFLLYPKSDTPDTGNPDDATGFRFFTELLGWTPEASLGSNPADFYTFPITDRFSAGYEGPVVAQGLGNWGVHVTADTPMTVVVDVPNLKVYIKEGIHEVTFLDRTPEFH